MRFHQVVLATFFFSFFEIGLLFILAYTTCSKIKHEQIWNMDLRSCNTLILEYDVNMKKPFTVVQQLNYEIFFFFFDITQLWDLKSILVGETDVANKQLTGLSISPFDNFS